MEATAIYKGKRGRVLASYSERLHITDQLLLRREWHRSAPDARWLRIDEVGGSIFRGGVEIATLPGDYKLLVLFSEEDRKGLHF